MCTVLFLLVISSIFIGIVLAYAFFKSLDKPKLREALILTVFCMPCKVLCSLFNISKTICLDKR